jgi:hypothetical protein
MSASFRGEIGVQQDRIGAGFYWRFVLVGIVTYVLHEAAHWVTGLALGYPVAFSLNGVTPSGQMTASDHVLFSLAGPAITAIGAVAAFVWLRRDRALTAYAIIYFAFFMRLVAAAASLFNPNDEARASTLLGLGMWTLPAIMVLALGALTIVSSRALRLSWKVNVGAYVVSSVVISAIVGLDTLLRALGPLASAVARA